MSELRIFPESVTEALAMAYLNSRDLTEKTPEDIARIYEDAYRRIYAERRAISKEKREQKQNVSY